MRELKQLIPQETCLKCEVCCRFSDKNSVWAPVLSGDEARNLANKDLSKVKILDNNQFELIATNGGYICPCLSVKDNRCKIYEFRPFECQLYPFLITKNGQKINLAVDLKCPFIYKGFDSGAVKKDLGFSRFVQYLTALFNSKNIIDFIRNNPRLIGNYTEDVITVVTLEKLSSWIINKNNETTPVSSPNPPR